MPALRRYLLPPAALATLALSTPDWHTECVGHQQQFCVEVTLITPLLSPSSLLA